LRSLEIEARFPEGGVACFGESRTFISGLGRKVTSMCKGGGIFDRRHPSFPTLGVDADRHHTVVLKTLMAHFEGRPLERLWDLPYIHPVCLNLVRVSEGKREILLHGDIGHFPEEWRGQ